MPGRFLLPVIFLWLAACVAATDAGLPNDREWNLIVADHQWLETLRSAQKKPAANAPRKEQIETALENHRKIEQAYARFLSKITEYFERTRDPRAAHLLATEKIANGDEYMKVLSRYDRALEQYRAALELEPSNVEAQQRIEAAEARRFVSMDAFAGVKPGMKEQDVRSSVGLPREDWIKQVVQRNRVYSVWIYPKADGGAAAIYFDNGIVYHTNWNAATPPAK